MSNRAVKPRNQKTRGARGRPKKVRTRIYAMEGIVSEPSNASNDEMFINAMELKCDNPIIFTKFFKLAKNYNANIVRFKFTETDIHLYADDHLKKNIISMTLHGRRMNRYYCMQPFDICVDVSGFLVMVKGIGDEDDYILLESVKYDMYSKLNISIKTEQDLQTDILTLLPLEEDIWDTINAMIIDEVNYPINISIVHKKLKAHITKWINMSEKIEMVQVGTDKLNVKCRKDNELGTHCTRFDDGVTSKLGEEDLFSVPITLSHWKPFATSLIGLTANISVSQEEPMINTSKLYFEYNKPVKAVPDTEKGIIRVFVSLN